MTAHPPASVASALAVDADLDARLRTLLGAAVPRIAAHAAALRPRLILLMGSGARGEAAGAKTEGHWLPLSDLDVALFTERPAPPGWRAALRDALARDLRGVLHATGLRANPLDVGLFPLLAFYRAALTLELFEGVSAGPVLWGDPACLEPRRGERPGPFEAQRLFTNRVHETLLPESGRSWLRLAAPTAPRWSGAPHAAAGSADAAGPADIAEWREANRWAKLAIDSGKAWLAAQGHYESSLRARPARIHEVAAAERAGDPAWLGHLARWTAWRLAPAWPPPGVDLASLAASGREVLGLVARQAGVEAEGLPVEPRAWRRLLAKEEGPSRERLRGWKRLLWGDPGAAMVSFALRWASHAWPVSLATLCLSLAWVEAVGATSGLRGLDGEEGRLLRRAIAREVPECRALAAGQWDGSWEGAFAAWTTRARAAQE